MTTETTPVTPKLFTPLMDDESKWYLIEYFKHNLKSDSDDPFETFLKLINDINVIANAPEMIKGQDRIEINQALSDAVGHLVVYYGHADMPKDIVPKDKFSIVHAIYWLHCHRQSNIQEHGFNLMWQWGNDRSEIDFVLDLPGMSFYVYVNDEGIQMYEIQPSDVKTMAKFYMPKVHEETKEEAS